MSSRGRIKRGEERGPLDEAGVQAAMSPKEERREGKRGIWDEGRVVRVERQPNAGEKEKCIVHKDGECGTMPRPRENGVPHAQYRQRLQGTQRNDLACVARSTKHRAWDKTST